MSSYIDALKILLVHSVQVFDWTCLNTGNVYFNIFAELKVYGAVLIAIYFETVLFEVIKYSKLTFGMSAKPDCSHQTNIEGI